MCITAGQGTSALGSSLSLSRVEEIEYFTSDNVTLASAQRVSGETQVHFADAPVLQRLSFSLLIGFYRDLVF